MHIIFMVTMNTGTEVAGPHKQTKNNVCNISYAEWSPLFKIFWKESPVLVL